MKDYTLNEIMAITGRSKTSIYAHINKIPLSKKKQKEISENHKQRALRVADSRRGKALRPYKRFDEWTPQRVLLVGHLAFDGEMARATCAYNNRSLALIARVENLMKSVYDYEPRRYTNKITGVSRISYHNVSLAAFFKDKHKELVENIDRMPKDYQLEFIRAFFDDEGCMDFRKTENKRCIRGYQKDKKILKLIQKLLQGLDIESKLKGRNEVVITGKENLIKFQREINFSKDVRINPNRTNSVWKKNLEKRKLLDMAIKTFKT